jgi:hydrogenase expression/formation protein HypE
MNQNPKVQLNCPVPFQDFDAITLGHGGGGKLTQKLLEEGVFTLLNNDWLMSQGDAANLSLDGEYALSTDSFVVSPIIFPGGTIGDLAVNGTVNDLAVSGAEPKYLTLSFILEEGLSTSEFWEILISIRDACTQAGVMVVSGDTKVVEKGKGDRIFINTTGIGKIHTKARLGMKYIRPGDKIILSGPPARHGIAIMSKRQGLEFETTLTSDTRPLHHICQEMLEKFGDGIRFMRDPTRGGVATVLHDIVRQTKLGIEIHENRLPLENEVAGACEMLGLDPLYVANEGIFVCIADHNISDDCLHTLHSWEYGSQASVIGNIVEEHPGGVLMHSNIGGKRMMPQASGELLPRIC